MITSKYEQHLKDIGFTGSPAADRLIKQRRIERKADLALAGYDIEESPGRAALTRMVDELEYERDYPLTH